MRKRTLAREHALKLLYQVNLTNDDLDETVAFYWANLPQPVEEEVRQFAERIVKGTRDRLSHIDSVISKYAENWDIDRMAVIDRNVLRFATYELLFLSGEIPPKVVINESVNIAKKFSTEESGRFVNGVLDKINHSEPRVGELPPAA